MKYKRISNCRICNSTSVSDFLDLGAIPLPNGFIKKEDLNKKEALYPLVVCACLNCGLVQLRYIVNQELMFRNYIYIPSGSKTRMNNFEEITNQALQILRPHKVNLAVDIGSNDGSLLTFFKRHGIQTLGIDPAVNLAALAAMKGIETINDYVSVKLAKKIVKKYGYADVITATNVVAHVNDLHDLFSAIEILLSKKGVFICEFPYLLDLIQKHQFDTIYHEHLSYFSMTPFMVLLEKHKLQIEKVVRTTIDGGSLRMFIKKRSKKRLSNSVKALLKIEGTSGLHNINKLNIFANEVKKIGEELHSTLVQLKKNGFSIAAYGAAAKGNILLNYCKINNRLIDFVVDSTLYKQGLYTPGTTIPIVAENEILSRQPSHTLILAWNFAEEIIKKQQAYLKLGGKFILPVPKIKIIQ